MPPACRSQDTVDVAKQARLVHTLRKCGRHSDVRAPTLLNCTFLAMSGTGSTTVVETLSRASGVRAARSSTSSLAWRSMYTASDTSSSDDSPSVAICAGETYVLAARTLGVAMVS